MDGNMVLIMVDECGDEVEVARYTLRMDLDDDELEVWKERKLDKAYAEYPEAIDFYFEDRRNWEHEIMMSIRQWF